jgi:hypothetical protein
MTVDTLPNLFAHWRERVGIIGAGLLLLGPLAWGFIRQQRGLPAFDNNAAALRLPD